MKKILIAFSIFSVFATMSFAQGNGVQTGTFKSSGGIDSITCISNTANYLYITPTLGYSTATVQVSARRKSSAMGGTAFLQGSVDNSTWYNAANAAGDTVTISDAATSVGKITIPPTSGLPYKYYRIKVTGASSDTMYVKGIFCGRY